MRLFGLWQTVRDRGGYVASAVLLNLARMLLNLALAGFQAGILDRKAARNFIRISVWIQKGSSWIIRRQMRQIRVRQFRVGK